MHQPAGRLSRAAWAVVGLLWVVALLNYLDRQLVVTMPGPIKADLGIGDERFGLLSSVFLWVYGFCSPVAGYVADRFGKRPVIIASLLIWSAATFYTGIANSFAEILVGRATLGISEAFYMPAAVSLIVEYHRGATRSRATGLHLSGVYAGSVLGGLGGGMAELFGWRAGFLAFGAIGVAYALVLMIFLPHPADGRVLPRPDEAQQQSSSLPWKEVFATLLATPSFLFLLAMNLLNGAAYWPVRNWLPEFFRAELGVSPTLAGIYGPMAFNGAAFAGMLIASNASDWWSQIEPASPRACPGDRLLHRGAVPLHDRRDRLHPAHSRVRVRRRNVARISRRQPDAGRMHGDRLPPPGDRLRAVEFRRDDRRRRDDLRRRHAERPARAIRSDVPGRERPDPYRRPAAIRREADGECAKSMGI